MLIATNIAISVHNYFQFCLQFVFCKKLIHHGVFFDFSYSIERMLNSLWTNSFSIDKLNRLPLFLFIILISQKNLNKF